jgi:CheY-like chemotaxis protein
MLSIPLHDNVVFQENDPYVEPLFVDDNGRILRFPPSGLDVMPQSANGQNNSLDTKTAEEAILIIDDDFVIRQALSDIFSDFYTETPVYTAANGHEGLQIVQQQPITLVLLDMNMPVMNGEQTYEKLQQIAPQVKVIVSSSLTPTEARLRFGERALPTFLQKPYDLTALLNAVQTELALA